MSDTVQPSDAFGLLRSFLAHRAYLAEATGLVGSDLARRATSRINAAAPERSKLAGQAAEKQRGLPDDATYWEAHGAARMTFLDVIEMVCDWFAAWKCYGDTRSWADSSALNLEKKGEHLSPAQRWLAEEVIVFLAERAK